MNITVDLLTELLANLRGLAGLDIPAGSQVRITCPAGQVPALTVVKGT